MVTRGTSAGVWYISHMSDPAQADRSRAADHAKSFAAGFSSTDLTAISGLPTHAAQLVDVFNAGAATENAVVVTARGVTLTVPLAAGERYPIEVPIITLSVSGADVSAVAYWWMQAGDTLNS